MKLFKIYMSPDGADAGGSIMQTATAEDIDSIINPQLDIPGLTVDNGNGASKKPINKDGADDSTKSNAVVDDNKSGNEDGNATADSEDVSPSGDADGDANKGTDDNDSDDSQEFIFQKKSPTKDVEIQDVEDYDFSNFSKELGKDVNSMKDLLNEVQTLKTQATESRKSKYDIINHLEDMLSKGATNNDIKKFFNVDVVDYTAKNESGEYKISDDDVIKLGVKTEYSDFNDDDIESYMDDLDGSPYKKKMEATKYRKMLASETEKYNEAIVKELDRKNQASQVDAQKRARQIESFHNEVDSFSKGIKDYDGVPVQEHVKQDFANIMKQPDFIDRIFTTKNDKGDDVVNFDLLFKSFVISQYDIIDKKSKESISKQAKREVYQKQMNYNSTPDNKVSNKATKKSADDEAMDALSFMEEKSKKTKGVLGII